MEAEEAGHEVSKSSFVAAAIGELSVGLCRGTIRCIGHGWACLQGCPAVGSARELLNPQRRCGNRYQCTDLCYVLWTGSSGLHAVRAGSHDDFLATYDLVLSLMSKCN
jgi:hypothetical protein